VPYTRVQQASNGNTSAALTITLGGTPAAGNLVVAWANSDATVTIGGSGWTAGPSQIDGNGAYTWYKIAGGSEPSAVVFTPSVSDFICAGLIEYNGAYATAAASLDVSTSSQHSGAVVATTNTVSVTPTTWSDLIIGVAALHKYNANTVDPTAPAWTGGLANLQAQGVGARTVKSCWTYYGDNLGQGQGGATSIACSWSSQTFGDAQILVIAFKTPRKDVALQAGASSTAATTRAASRTAAATAASSPAAGRSAKRTTAATAGTSGAVQRRPARTTQANAATAAGVSRRPARNTTATATTQPATLRAVTRLATAETAASAQTQRSLIRALSAAASATAQILRGATRTATATAATTAQTQRAPIRTPEAEATTGAMTARAVARIAAAEAGTSAETRRGPSRLIAATASATAQLLRAITRRADATALTESKTIATQPPQQQHFLIVRARLLPRWAGRITQRWQGRDAERRWSGREGPQ
jgi:hypothetical protein